MNLKKTYSQMVRLLKPDATDENWKYFGKEQAYFGVVSWPQFKSENMTEQARAEFFKTGENYIAKIEEIIRETVAPDFRPKNGLDFGCGVGRLVVPLAKRCGAVTGVDVSPDMIAEARRNCEVLKVSNASFAGTVDEVVGRGAKFDFIHSFIVFQHIRPKRGYEIFRKLVELLEEGGVGTVHFTYCHPGGKRAHLNQWLWRKFPLLWVLENWRRGRPATEPLMDMAEYSLNRLFRILQKNGCDICHTRFSDHGILGVVLVFKKKKLPAF